MDDFGELGKFLAELAEKIQVAEEIKTGAKTKVKVKAKYLNIIGGLHIYLSPGGFDKNAIANFVRTDPQLQDSTAQRLKAEDMKSLPEKQQGRLVLQSTAASLEASPLVDKVEVLEDVKADTDIPFDFPISTGCPCWFSV